MAVRDQIRKGEEIHINITKKDSVYISEQLLDVFYGQFGKRLGYRELDERGF